jgi:uncharacterized protein YdaU (DUF1376 family)
VREAPLPNDLAACCRLARAITATERAAVKSVLSEFFTPTDAGWTHKRCEREISKFKDGEPEREQKRANEDARMKRHREERARLFAELAAVAVHPPWNIGIGELRTLHATHTQRSGAVAPATQPATETATPRTATQYPLPTTHSPIPITHPSDEEDSGSARIADPPTPPPDFDGLNAEVLNGKAVVALAAGFQLPEPWGNDALALGFKAQEALREAEKFRQFFVAGRGAGKRRSVKGWRQSWSNWLEKAAKDMR